MNRVILFFVLIGFLGCDTSSNVEPIGGAYFLKFYGSSGDQEGVSVKTTPDGGFIIGGNSVAEFGGQSDYLLIKVDAFGNQEWTQTYDFNGSGEDDFLTEVLVDGTAYIVAGTSRINSISKIVLFRVDSNGIKVDEMIIDSISNEGYLCNGISKTSTGSFLVVGPVTNGVQEGKSLIAKLNNNFSFDVNDDFHLYPTGGADPTKPLIYVNALEVMNNNTNELNYLVFANEIDVGEINTRLTQFDLSFEGVGDFKPLNYANTEIKDVIQLTEKGYYILSSSQTETYLINVNETDQGYRLSTGQSIKSNLFLSGVSFNRTPTSQIVVSSNITEENSTTTFSSISETKATGLINWERIFGTGFSYTSGEVISLSDDSIVYTGTAGLKDQSKVFLIKLKSNGDMK